MSMAMTHLARGCWFAGIAVLLVVAGGGRSVHTQSAPPAGPFVKENATVKVAAHTFVIPDMNVGAVPNVGIIVGSRGTLVVDTGLGPRNGDVVLKEMRKVSTNQEVYLATTHVHPEHDLGASAFPASVVMIRSRDQLKDIDESGYQLTDTFRSRSPVMKELLEGAAFRKADRVFDGEMRLDLGGVAVRIFSVGPAHTVGDTAFWVEGDRVLFAGDLAMPALPAFASPHSSVRVWLASLDRFAALQPVLVVPSHGMRGDASLIADYQTYLRTIQRRTGELKRQGKTADEAADIITRELQPRYETRQPARIAPAVKAAFNDTP